MNAVIAKRLSSARAARPLFWITTALLAASILYPAFMAVIQAFVEGGHLSSIPLARALGHPTVARELRTTIIFAGGSTLGASIIGIALAWIITRTDVPYRRALEALSIVPLFMSAFVGAIAWRLLLAPRAGIIQRMLTSWGISPELLPDIYSITSMIVIQSIFYSPFMYLYAAASFRQMDPSLEEIARIHGAGPLRTLFRITFAVSGPALLSGMVLVFVFSVGTLEIPMALGVTGGNYVLSTRIFTLMNDFPRDTGTAAALGLLSILIAGAGILLQRRLLKGRKFTTVTGKGYQPRRLSLGGWRWVAFGLVAAYIVVAVLAPLTVLTLVGLQKFWTGHFAWSLFTLDNFYSVMIDYDVTRRALLNTLIACSIAATLAVAISLVLSKPTSARTESFIGFLVLLPMAIPGAVFGLAVLFAFVGTPLYRTLWIIVFAYVTGNLYLAYRTIYSVRQSIQDDLESVARIHGANIWQTTRRIVLPLLRPGIAIAWLMSFVIFVREFSSVMFLYRNGTEVMSVVFWILMERQPTRLAAFMIVQTALLLVVMIIYQRVAEKSEQNTAV